MSRRTDEFKRLAERVVALRQEGLTYEEIAARTGTPYGTVSGMLSRERARGAELDERLLEAERVRSKPKNGFTDDPRAERPDYGRPPMMPETTLGGSASSIEL